MFNSWWKQKKKKNEQTTKIACFYYLKENQSVSRTEWKYNLFEYQEENSKGFF